MKMICGIAGVLAVLAAANPCFCAPAAEHECCAGHGTPVDQDLPQDCCCTSDHLYSESKLSAIPGVASAVVEDTPILEQRPRLSRCPARNTPVPSRDKVPLWLEIRCLRR